jgi:hypothetical protein
VPRLVHRDTLEIALHHVHSHDVPLFFFGPHRPLDGMCSEHRDGFSSAGRSEQLHRPSPPDGRYIACARCGAVARLLRRKMTTRESDGTRSRSSSSCFAPSSRGTVSPVTFPPGRARLAIRPASTAPTLPTMTIGIVVVAFRAARADTLHPEEHIALFALRIIERDVVLLHVRRCLGWIPFKRRTPDTVSRQETNDFIRLAFICPARRPSAIARRRRSPRSSAF